MFKTPKGKFNWLNFILLIAAIAIIVTMVIIPIVNLIKANIPVKETVDTAETTARLLFQL